MSYSGYSERRVRARIKELERKVADHEAQAKSWESRLAEKSRMIGHAEARARQAERKLEFATRPQVTFAVEECAVRWCHEPAEPGRWGYCARCRKNIDSWKVREHP